MTCIFTFISQFSKVWQFTSSMSFKLFIVSLSTKILMQKINIFYKKYFFNFLSWGASLFCHFKCHPDRIISNSDWFVNSEWLQVTGRSWDFIKWAVVFFQHRNKHLSGRFQWCQTSRKKRGSFGPDGHRIYLVILLRGFNSSLAGFKGWPGNLSVRKHISLEWIIHWLIDIKSSFSLDQKLKPLFKKVSLGIKVTEINVIFYLTFTSVWVLHSNLLERSRSSEGQGHYTISTSSF